MFSNFMKKNLQGPADDFDPMGGTFSQDIPVVKGRNQKLDSTGKITADFEKE